MTDPVESKEHEIRLASEADASEATPVTCVPLAAMEVREHVRFQRTGVGDGCEPSRGCGELNICPLPEEKMLLTTEKSLQGLLWGS